MKCWRLTSKGLVSLQKLRSMTSLALPLHTKMTKSQSSRSQKKNENCLKSWKENLIIWQECWKTDWGPGQMVNQFKYLRYDSFSDLSRMVEKSSKGNEAVIIVEIFHWQEWKSFFADEFSLIKSIRNYHYFRFSAIHISESYSLRRFLQMMKGYSHYAANPCADFPAIHFHLLYHKVWNSFILLVKKVC